VINGCKALLEIIVLYVGVQQKRKYLPTKAQGLVLKVFGQFKNKTMKDFLIAGLQRSGTNYIETLLNKNIDNTKFGWEDWYWKHNINPPNLALFRQHNLRGIVLCVKNPLHWVESICFRNFADLYESYGVYYDMNDKSSLYFENHGRVFNVKALVKLYNEYYNNWLNNPQLVVHVANYESVLKEPTQFLNQFKDKFNLQFKSDELVIDIGKVFMSGAYTNTKLLDNYKNYQLSHLKIEHLEYIQQYLDIELLKKLGY